ncbi:MAG: 2-isopropylmalate synthase, partial [Acidimicrobiaceae bacterium]|nr:2-isopropylmalate synthase [Acidimicrobiaceae bacterium]
RLNVDYIEAGFPVASQGDFEAVQGIARTVGRAGGPVIAGLSRTQRTDVDRCWEALKDAARARIHVFISTSPQHMEHMLRMNEAQVKAETAAGVSRAREHTADVEFSPQDATRTPLDFMMEVLEIAVASGATTLNIPDTVGYGIPWDFGALIQYVRREIKGDYILSTHCHNDLGLAVANSLAGVQGGARQIEVCVNGLGERAGNAALEEVVMALKIRPDQFPGLETGVRTEELARTSRLVSRLTGYPVQFNKAVVGRNAFRHESGIHQHGVLAERTTYEIIDADSVGQTGSQIVLGKHSGRHAFSDTLAKMGLTVSGNALNAAFIRFKELADRKVEITDADLEAIVAEEIGTNVEPEFTLEALEVAGGTVGVPNARVVLVRGGEKVEAISEGDGMIDAACQAIRAATGVDSRLTDFNVNAVTGGIDALGDVIIQVVADGIRVSGRGVSTDVVEAAARAYLNAVNKVVRIRARDDRRVPEATP